MSQVSVSELVETILKGDLGGELVRRKKEFADILNIPSANSAQWIQSFNNVTIPPYDLFSEYLGNWVQRNGSLATIGNLTTILKHKFTATSVAVSVLGAPGTQIGTQGKNILINTPTNDGMRLPTYDHDTRLSAHQLATDVYNKPQDTSTKPLPESTDADGDIPKPVWLMWKPTKNFVGRDKHLMEIEEHFLQQISPLTILGLGGIGKSELAKRFGKESFHKGRNAVCFDARSHQYLLSSAKTLLAKMDCPKTRINDSDVGAIFQYAFESSLRHRPTLLVLDNVDVEELYESLEELISSFLSYPPGYPTPFLLITSRNRNLPSSIGGDVLELDVFQDTETISLLRESLERPQEQIDEVAALELCRTLGNFPLAMSQSIAYIIYRRKSNKSYGISDYIAAYKEEVKKMEVLGYKLPVSEHQYKLTTLTTWNLSFQSITQEPELGEIAENILNYWVYVENPNGKLLQYLINCYEVVEEIRRKSNSGPDETDNSSSLGEMEMVAYYNLTMCSYKNVKMPRYLSPFSMLNKENFSYKPPFTAKEKDIMDDTRMTARAVQLIRNHSIVSVEFVYSAGYQWDTQALGIHNLVLEVIQLRNKFVLNTEYKWLHSIVQGFLLQSTFRKWSVETLERFAHRAFLIQSLWKDIVQHPELIGDFATAIVHLMYDSLPTSLPVEKEGPYLFKHIVPIFSEKLGRNSLGTIVAQVYSWHHEFLTLAKDPLREKFSDRMKKQRKNMEQIRCNMMCLPELFSVLNAVKKGFPENDVLLNHARGLVIHSIYYGLIDPSTVIKEDGTLDDLLTLLRDVTTIFGSMETCKENKTNTLSTVWLMGGILELLEAAGLPVSDVKKFAMTMHQTFEECKSDWTYVIEFLNRYIGDDYDLPAVSTDKNQELLLGIAEEFMFPMSPSLVAKSVLLDFLSMSCPRFQEKHLNAIFESLSNSKNSNCLIECAVLSLKSADKLCIVGNYSAPWVILNCVKKIEQSWDRRRAIECLPIWKGIIPLGKYSMKLRNPHFIALWMDNILDRCAVISDDLHLEGLADRGEIMGVLLEANTAYSTQELLPFVIGAANNTLALPDIHWSEGSYEAWQSSMQLVLKSLNDIGIEGYGDSKVAVIIAERYLGTSEMVSNMPLQTSLWAFLHVISSHPSVMAKVAVLARMVDIIAEKCVEKTDEAEIEEYVVYIAKAGSDMYKREMLNFENHQDGTPFLFDIRRIYIYLYALMIIPTKPNENEYFDRLKAFFCLPSSGNNSETFVSVLEKVRAIMKHQDIPALNPIIIKVFCKFLSLYLSVEEELQDACSTPLGSFAMYIFNKFLNREYYTDLAGLCARLLQTISTRGGELCEKLRTTFHPVNIGTTLWNSDGEGILEVYAAFLKDNCHDLSSIRNEIRIEIYHRIVSLGAKEKWDNIDDCMGPALVQFLVTEGTELLLGLAAAKQKCQQLVDQVLKNHSPQCAALDAYLFGRRICDNRIKDQELVEFVINSVLQCLETACGTDVARLKAMFQSYKGTRSYTSRAESSVNTYVEQVSTCLKKWDIQLNERDFTDQGSESDSDEDVYSGSKVDLKSLQGMNVQTIDMD